MAKIHRPDTITTIKSWKWIGTARPPSPHKAAVEIGLGCGSRDIPTSWSAPLIHAQSDAERASRLLSQSVLDGTDASISQRALILLGEFGVLADGSLLGALHMIAEGERSGHPLDWTKLGFHFDNDYKLRAGVEDVMQNVHDRIAVLRKHLADFERAYTGRMGWIEDDIDRHQTFLKVLEDFHRTIRYEPAPKQGAPNTIPANTERVIADMVFRCFAAARVEYPSLLGARTRGCRLIHDLLALVYKKPPSPAAIYETLRRDRDNTKKSGLGLHRG